MSRHFLLPLLIVAALALAAGADDDPWTVTLRDGTTLEGTLVRLLPSQYVLQTADGLLELTDDDIDPRTFATRSRDDAAPKQKLSVATHYEELHRDGTATLRLNLYSRHTGRTALTMYRFGLAPWEQRSIDQREIRDQYGTKLEPQFDPPRQVWEEDWDRRVQVDVPLAVPVMPGELWSTTSIFTRSAHFQKTENGYLWQHWGDYAEDRVLTLKVQLPEGVTLQRTEPVATSTFEENGHTYVMWRQFYKKGERRPLSIYFTAD